jgi:hypothetical protein
MKGSFSFRGFGCAVSAALLSLVAGHAAAQDRPASPGDGPLGNHQRNVRVEIGARTQFIKSAGFDPFSTRDVLPQLSLGASVAFLRQDKWSLAAMVGYDYGGSSERLRSDEASLDLHRFTLAPEVRYHLLRVLALTAKVGPTLTREGAEVSGPLGTSMLKTGWKFGFDATAGVAVELWGYADGASHKPRVWLLGEGGYGWSAPMALKFKPENPGAAPQRLAPLDLGELSLSGPLFRISAGLSFW